MRKTRRDFILSAGGIGVSMSAGCLQILNSNIDYPDLDVIYLTNQEIGSSFNERDWEIDEESEPIVEGHIDYRDNQFRRVDTSLDDVLQHGIYVFNSDEEAESEFNSLKNEFAPIDEDSIGDVSYTDGSADPLDDSRVYSRVSNFLVVTIVSPSPVSPVRETCSKQVDKIRENI